MAETTPGVSPEELQEDRILSTLESKTTESIEISNSFQDDTHATEVRGKGKERARKKRADHKMLPPEILETYGSSA